jgi:hypothetical protein
MKTLWTKTTRGTDKSRQTREAARPRTLQMESLERRELYAGNVTAVVDGQGILQITGDSQGNCVAIDAAANGDIWVHGCNYDAANDEANFAGTTSINGVPNGSVVFAKSIVKGVKVSLLGGNDFFGSLQGGPHVKGPVEVWMGYGNDRVNMDFYTNIEGNLTINTESGDDKVLFSVATIQGTATANTGAGNDRIEAPNYSLFKKGLTLNTSTGNDQVLMMYTQVKGKTKINTGDGSDTVCIHDALFENDVEILLGKAAGFLAFDVLDVEDSTFQDAFKADGQEGGDIFDDDNNVFGGSKSASNFEVTNVDLDCTDWL